MAKRAPTKSLAAQAMARERWNKTTAPQRKEATEVARAARWPRCKEPGCGEREGHEVHIPADEALIYCPLYTHPFKK